MVTTYAITVKAKVQSGMLASVGCDHGWALQSLPERKMAAVRPLSEMSVVKRHRKSSAGVNLRRGDSPLSRPYVFRR